MSTQVQPESMTLDEIGRQVEAAEAAAKVPDLSTVKLEGDTVPEHLRGKTAAELLTFAKGLEDSLRKSEAARVQPQVTERIIERAAPTVTEPAAKPAPTKEQLAELFTNDPVAAMEVYGQHVAQSVLRNLEQRIGPLAQGSAQAAERQAREKFKDEFELFGDQITQIKSQLPDPSVLSQPQSWDDLVSYVRGQPQNFDKLYDHRTKKRGEDLTRSEAQEAQVVAAPAHFSPQSRTPAPVGAGAPMDDLQKEIARNLFPELDNDQAYKEYAKWQRIK